eukprot:4028-Heterococcus_DN1.PRE.2
MVYPNSSVAVLYIDVSIPDGICAGSNRYTLFSYAGCCYTRKLLPGCTALLLQLYGPCTTAAADASALILVRICQSDVTKRCT